MPHTAEVEPKTLSSPSLSCELPYPASGMDNLQDDEMCPTDEASGEHIHLRLLCYVLCPGSIWSKCKTT